MKLKMKFTDTGYDRTVEIPFDGTEQYVDVALLEVTDTGGEPSDINRQSFKCKLSVNRRGKLEINY